MQTSGHGDIFTLHALNALICCQSDMPESISDGCFKKIFVILYLQTAIAEAPVWGKARWDVMNIIRKRLLDALSWLSGIWKIRW